MEREENRSLLEKGPKGPRSSRSSGGRGCGGLECEGWLVRLVGQLRYRKRFFVCCVIPSMRAFVIVLSWVSELKECKQALSQRNAIGGGMVVRGGGSEEARRSEEGSKARGRK